MNTTINFLPAIKKYQELFNKITRLYNSVLSSTLYKAPGKL